MLLYAWERRPGVSVPASTDLPDAVMPRRSSSQGGVQSALEEADILLVAPSSSVASPREATV